MSDESAGCRLFVGNLSWGTNDDSLRDAFSGEDFSVVEAKVIMDRYSGRSRGFGFVSFKTPQDAESAKEKMNGAEVDGRPVRVDMASSNQRN